MAKRNYPEEVPPEIIERFNELIDAMEKTEKEDQEDNEYRELILNTPMEF